MELSSLDYLKRQVFYTGFGNSLSISLEQSVAKELKEFQLTFSREFGNDKAGAVLHFSRSDQGHYFFNKYDLKVDRKDGTSVEHTFYINNKSRPFVEGEKPVSKTFTIKEAYNQLSGRFVLKTMDNKDGMETTLWRGIDFKQLTEQGRFKTLTFPAANLDIGKSLTALGYPVKELQDKVDAKELIQAIERGDRVYVTLLSEGQEYKRRLVADPKYKTLNIETPAVQKKMEQGAESKEVSESNSQDKAAEQKEGVRAENTQAGERRRRFLGF